MTPPNAVAGALRALLDVNVPPIIELISPSNLSHQQKAAIL
jgi:hypothetical protein